MAAAHALPHDREAATLAIGSSLHTDWPQPDLLNVLPLQSDGPFGIWIVIELETGIVVGDIGFIGPPDGEGAVEIGYSVVRDRRGRGYAREAAGTLTDWALAQPGVGSVVAGCATDNVASIRTLEGVGFERMGETGAEIRWRLRR